MRATQRSGVWALIVICTFVEIILAALIWKGPLVDTREHRKGVYDLVAGANTNRVEAQKAYEFSLSHRRREVRNTRAALLAVAALNGAALFLLVSRLASTEVEDC